MKNLSKYILALVVLMSFTFLVPTTAEAKTKTKSITIDVYLDGKVEWIFPKDLKKYKKIKVTSSNTKAIKAKYEKNKEMGNHIALKAVGDGTSTVTVKCLKGKKVKKTYKYKVRSIVTEKGYKGISKKAFKIQNQYRTDKNVPELQWSETLYKFALYRIKTSGFDEHRNLIPDTAKFFGNYAVSDSTLLAENMATGYKTEQQFMKAWKNSKGHYKNLLDKEHTYGAIAIYQGMAIAIFCDKSPEEMKELEDYKNFNKNTIAVTVKHLNTRTGEYLGGFRISYFDVTDRWGSVVSKNIAKAEGKVIYLEKGKTYKIMESVPPDGCYKAESVKITVAEDGPKEIIFKSE